MTPLQRLICWFPPDEETVVVALFSGDKANMGDVFYDSVGRRADQIIDKWIREGEVDEDGAEVISGRAMTALTRSWQSQAYPSVLPKTERREDMLLSTLMYYLSAAGVEDAKMVVHVNSREIELDLRSLQQQAKL